MAGVQVKQEGSKLESLNFPCSSGCVALQALS